MGSRANIERFRKSNEQTSKRQENPPKYDEITQNAAVDEGFPDFLIQENLPASSKTLTPKQGLKFFIHYFMILCYYGIAMISLPLKLKVCLLNVSLVNIDRFRYFFSFMITFNFQLIHANGFCAKKFHDQPMNRLLALSVAS